MAITSVGARGFNGVGNPAGTTLTLSTTSEILAGRVALLVIAKDNTSTTDGDNGEVVSVTDTAGNVWEKLGEYTNSPTGAAADGVCVSIWKVQPSTTFTSGTITMTFAASTQDRCASLWEFSVEVGKTLRLAAAISPNEINAANGFGSVAFSGLPSREYLFFRGLSKEANSTTQITATSSFNTISQTRSRNNANAVIVRGEFRIVTATSATSNPTLNVSGDTAGLFLALFEDEPTVLVADPGTLGLTGADADLLTDTPPVVGATTQLGPLGVSQRLYGSFAGKVGSTAHDLTADAGSLALTGADASVVSDRFITAEAASLTVTGQDASLIDSTPVADVRVTQLGPLGVAQRRSGSFAGRAASYDLIADAGVLQLFLEAADLTVDQGFLIVVDEEAIGIAEEILSPTPPAVASPVTETAEAGFVGLTGHVAQTAIAMPAVSGSLSLTGQPATLLPAYVLIAEAGALTISSPDAPLVLDTPPGSFSLEADPLALTITGAAATVVGAMHLEAESLDLGVLEQSAELLTDYALSLDPVSLALTGSDTTFTTTQAQSFELVADPLTLVVMGFDAGTVRELVLEAEALALTLSGDDADVVGSLHITAESGALTVTGEDAILLANDLLAEATALVITGSAAFPTIEAVGAAGTVTLTGQAAALLVDYVLRADPGTLTVAGKLADLSGRSNPIAITFSQGSVRGPRFVSHSIRVPRFANETVETGGSS